jgi:hypothetical protein
MSKEVSSLQLTYAVVAAPPHSIPVVKMIEESGFAL